MSFRMAIHSSFSYALIILLIIIAAGCASIQDTPDKLLGSYLKGLEQNRENGESHVIHYSIAESFERVLNVLMTMDAQIIKVDIDSYAILALVSGGPMLEDSVESTFDANSADVGIFFSEEGSQQTRITISCFSSTILEHAAKNIFPKL